MRIRSVKKVITGLFIAGLIAGVLYVNVFVKSYITSMGIFSDYFLEKTSRNHLIIPEYMVYIAKERVFPFIAFALLCSTIYRKIAGGIGVLWTGFSGGVILSASILKLNLKGILFCIFAIIPHFICYGAAYIMLLAYSFLYPEVRWSSTKTICIIIFLMLGIITECYLNPVLLDLFIGVSDAG